MARAKTGGRKPGVKNKSTTEVQAFVERVYAKLKKDKKLTPEDLSVALLTCGDNRVIQKELESLRAYRFGKPAQPVTGEGGSGPVNCKIEFVNHIERPVRKNADRAN